ncbi:MAG TPA: hypothetical protein PLA71_00995 [Saccharofermentans sp.]|nr:hypothetical protein [Saccharofermentans sp.]
MAKHKYIIMQVQGSELPILFHPVISHDLIGCSSNVISAGFCSMNVEEGKNSVACYGNSVSLNVESRGEVDEEIILKWLNNNMF